MASLVTVSLEGIDLKTSDFQSTPRNCHENKCQSCFCCREDSAGGYMKYESMNDSLPSSQKAHSVSFCSGWGSENS